MAMIEVREHYLDDPLLPKLFIQSWLTKDSNPKGCILITHGMSEHSELYDPLARQLCEQNYWVFAWDLQGHGRSQGQRGFVKNFNEYSRDLKSIIAKIKQDDRVPSHNLHLLSHSMGGLIVLQTLLSEDAPRVTSATFSSPALKVALPIPKIKSMASHWLNQFWPTLTLNNGIRYEYLSRDPKMVASYFKDPLRHTKVSAPLFLGMMAAMDEVWDKVRRLSTPVYFQIAGQDRLISTQASLDFYKLIPGQKKLSLYEDSYHEVYNDLNRQQVIDDLIAYLGQWPS